MYLIIHCNSEIYCISRYLCWRWKWSHQWDFYRQKTLRTVWIWDHPVKNLIRVKVSDMQQNFNWKLTKTKKSKTKLRFQQSEKCWTLNLIISRADNRSTQHVQTQNMIYFYFWYLGMFLTKDFSWHFSAVNISHVWIHMDESTVTKVICHPDIFTLASLSFATLRKSNK